MLTIKIVLLAELFLRGEAKVIGYLDAHVENMYEITQAELEETERLFINLQFRQDA